MLEAMDRVIERDDQCFCCGVDNERGLHLVFSYPRPGEAEAELTIPEQFSGWKRTTHGGFLSMLLDEVMAHACASAGSGAALAAVTGEITVRFIKPVDTGARVRLSGSVAEQRGRIISTRGSVYDADGAAVAEAKARFVVVDRA